MKYKKDPAVDSKKNPKKKGKKFNVKAYKGMHKKLFGKTEMMA